LRLSDLPRYWHTLKYLKPVQFYGRLWFRLARTRPDLSPPPDIREASGAWRLPARREPMIESLRLDGLDSNVGCFGLPAAHPLSWPDTLA